MITIVLTLIATASQQLVLCKVHTVWHENSTWNLILWFYGQWQTVKLNP